MVYETRRITKNEGAFKESMNQFLNEESTKQGILNIMTAMQANNTTVAKREINNMLNNLDEVYSDKLWGIDFVNQIIKDQFIEELRESLIGIVE